MKKIILLAAALSAFGTAQAQVSIIPKGGLTLATQHTNKSPDPDGREISATHGFTAGIGFNVPVGKKLLFSIQPELLFIQKGYRSTFDRGIVGTVVGNNILNYLEMPVLGQVRFGTDRFKVFATAGPSLAYGLNGTYSSTYIDQKHSVDRGRILFRKGPETADPNVWYLAPQLYNRLDVGIQAGLGVGLAVGPGVVQLEARYGHGLTAFFKGNEVTDFVHDNDPDFWNRAAAFTLGYAIPLNGKQ